MRHRESAGHEGLVTHGGVQWMTAGRGLVHSEMPEQEQGRMEGFQLWLNLPASDKLRAPWYRDFRAGDIPEVALPGARVRVIAGQALGEQGVVVAGAVRRAVTEPVFLDLQLDPGAPLAQPLPERHNTFVYVYRGTLAAGGVEVPRERMAILANAPGSDGILVQAGPAGARAILVAGAPLNEPIVQYGPFVMNTREQILQAFDDYQRGAFA
jgi:hypothetical protein